MLVSRRQLFALGLGGMSTLLLSQCSTSSNTLAGSVFPSVMSSHDGVLDVELIAALTEVPVGTGTGRLMTYNG